MCLTNVLSKQFVHFKIQRINEIIVNKDKIAFAGIWTYVFQHAHPALPIEIKS